METLTNGKTSRMIYSEKKNDKLLLLQDRLRSQTSAPRPASWRASFLTRHNIWSMGDLNGPTCRSDGATRGRGQPKEDPEHC
jgi:hypothetical protein